MENQENSNSKKMGHEKTPEENSNTDYSQHATNEDLEGSIINMQLVQILIY